MCFIPGHNQSPAGNFARILRRPYLNENESRVKTFPLRTGDRIESAEQWCSQPAHGVVQLNHNKVGLKKNTGLLNL